MLAAKSEKWTLDRSLDLVEEAAPLPVLWCVWTSFVGCSECRLLSLCITGFRVEDSSWTGAWFPMSMLSSTPLPMLVLSWSVGVAWSDGTVAFKAEGVELREEAFGEHDVAT